MSEAQRLQALRCLEILDTAPEERFDRITRLVARTFDCPMSAIGFVDEARVWFKSCFGVELSQAPRESTYCNFVVQAGQPLVVRDAWQDPRFKTHPAAQADPATRFYVGHPLRAPDGRRIGSICAFDHVPREVTAEQLQTLADLAAMAEQQLHLKTLIETQRALEASEQQYRALIEPNPDAVYTIDTARHFSSCNGALLTLTGYGHEDLIGMPFARVIVPEDLGRVEAQFEQCLAGKPQYLQARILHKDGSAIYASISASPYVVDGELRGVVGIARDVTPQVLAEQRLQESEARLSLALASSRQGVWECDVTTRRLYQSPELRMILGYPKEAAWESDEAWYRRIHPA